eukprot:1187074-Prorocentrum_minimum.AAC.2
MGAAKFGFRIAFLRFKGWDLILKRDFKDPWEGLDTNLTLLVGKFRRCLNNTTKEHKTAWRFDPRTERLCPAPAFDQEGE